MDRQNRIDRAIFAEYIGKAIDGFVLPELDDELIACLVDDLTDMHTDEQNTNTDDTLEVWLRRIGGWANVPSYAAYIKAARDRR